MATEYIAIDPPGVLLREIIEYLEVTPYKLAKAIGKAPIQISRILSGEASITPPMSILLGRALEMSPSFWLNMQNTYDLRMAEREIDTTSVMTLKEVRALEII